MKYYALGNDVYLVNGAARSAIYDLRNGQLFSINKKIRSLLERTQAYNAEDICRDEEEKKILEKFLLLQIVTKADAPQPLKNIKELARSFAHIFAWIEVTRQCNLSCTFCYESSNPHCIEKMSFNDFKLLIKNLKEYGISRIQFIGGEPMVLKDILKEMIVYARPHFDFIEVYTNGTTINEEWCNFFRKNNINIAISIHSYLPEEHDKVTQVKGSHKRVERAQHLLEKHNIPYRIGTVQSKACNVGIPPENASYLLSPKMPKASGLADIFSYDFEMFKLKAIKKESKSYPISKDFIMKSVSGHQCFNKNIYISTTLDVYPCVMERRNKHGNLSKNQLKDIIKDPISKLTKDFVNGCKDCEYRYGCFDCRPDSNGNNFLDKPWYCSYNPKSGEWCDLQEMYNTLIKKAKSKNYVVKTIETQVQWQ